MNALLRAGLLRVYPPAWRARYGAELETLILAAGADGESSWRTGLNVLAAGSRERARNIDLAGDGGKGQRQGRVGILVVLCSWALLVVGGAGVQKFSEHWEAATPISLRPLPVGAFTALMIAGSLGCALVAAGIVIALPSLFGFLRTGGWPALRGPVLRAGRASILGVAATVSLVTWAKGLDGAQRNGADLGYSIAFLSWAGLLAAVLLAWTGAAFACGRRIVLSERILRIEAGIGVGVACSAVVATAAAAVWWGALAADSPWVLYGGAPGSSGSVIAVPLLLATATMAAGSILAAAGARRCALSLSKATHR